MTTTKITVGGKDYVLYSKLKAVGVPFPNTDPNDKMKHNNFEIEVRRMENGTIATTKKFDWYDSNANFKAGVVVMTEEDVKGSFKAFIEDGISGMMGFEEFASNFGYGTDSRRAERIHETCKESLRKLDALGITKDKIYNVSEELSEQGIE